MKKRIITGLVALTSMVSSAAAQDIHRTAETYRWYNSTMEY